MKLYIGNKKYSSWSFRPWIAMRAKQIEFEDEVVPFNEDAVNPDYVKFSPTSKVPVLIDGELAIWESLAILEYLADRFPDKDFWPTDIAAKAHARSISNEMHGGFFGIRGRCPMNMARPIKAIEEDAAVRKDVTRIEQIWQECLDKYGGPFLFGEFCNADAMFAPVVNRIEKYVLSDHQAVKSYSEAMLNHPAYKEWEVAGIAEEWIVPADEA